MRYFPEIAPESVRRRQFPISFSCFVLFCLRHKFHCKLIIIYFESISVTVPHSILIYEGLQHFRKLWIGKTFLNPESLFKKFHDKRRNSGLQPYYHYYYHLTSMHRNQYRNSLRNSYQLEQGKRNSWKVLQLMALLIIFNDKIMLHTHLEHSKAYKPWQKL